MAACDDDLSSSASSSEDNGMETLLSLPKPVQPRWTRVFAERRKQQPQRRARYETQRVEEAEVALRTLLSRRADAVPCLLKLSESPKTMRCCEDLSLPTKTDSTASTSWSKSSSAPLTKLDAHLQTSLSSPPPPSYTTLTKLDAHLQTSLSSPPPPSYYSSSQVSPEDESSCVLDNFSDRDAVDFECQAGADNSTSLLPEQRVRSAQAILALNASIDDDCLEFDSHVGKPYRAVTDHFFEAPPEFFFLQEEDLVKSSKLDELDALAGALEMKERVHAQQQSPHHNFVVREVNLNQTPTLSLQKKSSLQAADRIPTTSSAEGRAFDEIKEAWSVYDVILGLQKDQSRGIATTKQKKQMKKEDERRRRRMSYKRIQPPWRDPKGTPLW